MNHKSGYKSMCVNCARVFFEMVKRSIALMGLASFVLLQSCGGGGGGGAAAEEETPATTQSVSGGGVKGPLAFAIVNVYTFDATTANLRSAIPIATASTDATASIVGLALPVPLTPPYILEFTSDAATRDITTQQFPVISTMRTVLTTALLATGEQIYATPLTTMAVDIAVTNATDTDGDGTISDSEFLAAIDIAATQVVSTLGFGLSGSIDIFDTPPLIDDTTTSVEDQTAVAAYRTAVEALTAVVAELGTNSAVPAVSTDEMLAALTADLADGGGIDGSVVGGPIDATVVSDLGTADPTILLIPNTNLTASDVEQILVTETATTGSTTDTSQLEPSGSIDTTPEPAVADPDLDSDGVLNSDDAFPNDPAESADSDLDTIGDNADNCPADANTNQLNTDGDSQGNVCDLDDDNDGLTDAAEAALGTNPLLVDTDSDGVNDNVDAFPTNPAETADIDGDTIGDVADNCPADANTNQLNTDGDGVGNVCDADDDNDGLTDTAEAALGTNPLLEDTDSDGVNDNVDAFPTNGSESTDTDSDNIGDNSDNCPFNANTNQADTDGDGIGDICDGTNNLDLDGDGVNIPTDNCPSVANPNQLNSDTDAAGNACDLDDDNDGLTDADEATLGTNPLLADTDNDGVNDNADAFPENPTETLDTDSDNIGDNADNCPADANTNQLNTDGDSQGNVCDADDDNDGLTDAAETALGTNPLLVDTDSDGVNDNVDAFPTNPAETADTDGDTIGDVADNCPVDANTNQLDTDGNGIGDVCEGPVVLPNIQGTWRITQTVRTVDFIGNNFCSETVGDSWSSYAAVSQNGSDFTMINFEGDTYTGTVDAAGNIAFSGTNTNDDPIVDTATSTGTFITTDVITATGLATDNSITAGEINDRVSFSGFGDACDVVFDFTATKVYTLQGTENYSGLYTFELEEDFKDPSDSGSVIGTAFTAEFIVSGNSIDIHFDGGGDECSQVLKPGEPATFDPATGAFSAVLETNCTYGTNTAGELHGIKGLFTRAPDSTETSVSAFVEIVEREINADGIQTYVSRGEVFAYGRKVVADRGYTRINQKQMRNNKTISAIHMGFLDPSLRKVSTTLADLRSGNLFLEVLDVDGTTPLCSTPYTTTTNGSGETLPGRFVHINRVRADAEASFDNEEFVTGPYVAYSSVNCDTTAQDGSATVFNGGIYTLRVVDAGADGLFGNADDTEMLSKLVTAEVNTSPFTSLVKREDLRFNGARVSASQTGFNTPVWGFFNPAEDIIVSWANSSFAEAADTVLVRTRELDENNFSQVSTPASNTSVAIPFAPNELINTDPYTIQVRHIRDEATGRTDAIAGKVLIQPGIQGLFNIELGRGLPNFPIYLRGEQFNENVTVFGLNECGSGTDDISCTGGSVDMTSNTVTLNLQDVTGNIIGGGAFNLTLHFSNAAKAEVTSSSGIAGIPSTPQGASATTAAKAAAPEFFSRTRLHSHRNPGATTATKRTVLTATNMLAVNSPWSSAVITRADGGDIVKINSSGSVVGTTGVTSFTLWDNTSISGNTFLEKINEFTIYPLNDGNAQGSRYSIAAATEELTSEMWGLIASGDYELRLVSNDASIDDLVYRTTYTRDGTAASNMITPSMSRGDTVTLNGTACNDTTVCNNAANAVSDFSIDTLSWPVDINVPSTAVWSVIVRAFDGAQSLDIAQQRAPKMLIGSADLVLDTSAATATTKGIVTWTNNLGAFDLQPGAYYTIQIVVHDADKGYESKVFGVGSKDVDGDRLYLAVPGV